MEHEKNFAGSGTLVTLCAFIGNDRKTWTVDKQHYTRRQDLRNGGRGIYRVDKRFVGLPDLRTNPPQELLVLEHDRRARSETEHDRCVKKVIPVGR